MCIICVSPAGQELPTRDVITNMFVNNPDGAGFMFARTGSKRVFIRKGFMTCDDLLSALKKEHVSKEDAVIIHTRIATHGTRTEEMTHPFPVSGNTDALKQLRTSCHIGMAHNGIISLTADRTSTLSDSAIFARDIAFYYLRDKGLKDSQALAILGRLADSKLAFLDGEKNVRMIGDFVSYQGNYYSNYSFKPRNNYKYGCKKSVYDYEPEPEMTDADVEALLRKYHKELRGTM